MEELRMNIICLEQSDEENVSTKEYNHVRWETV
jgi:hypothetical protein